jgi:hypothetical protein
LRCDDVELIRWGEAVLFEGELEIPAPSELFYLQVFTDSDVEEVEVTYRTVRFEDRQP